MLKRVSIVLVAGSVMVAAQRPAILRHFPTVFSLEETSENTANVSMGDLDGDGDLDR